MNKESLTEKLLDLVEGRETPETWQNWWDEHETELEALLSRGEFLKLKPCRHGFQWVPVFGSQKGAIAILEKSGTAFEASNLYQERYLAELDAVAVDTPGFSILECADMAPEELSRAYREFDGARCRFGGCLHQNEPDCGVKERVAQHIVPQGRYDRYLELLQELQKRRERQYD